MNPWAILGAIAANAVPIVGVLAYGWSIGSVMLAVAFEFLFGAVLMTLKRVWHARRSGDPVYLPDAWRARHEAKHRRTSAKGPPGEPRSPGGEQAQWIIPGLGFMLFAGVIPLAFGKEWPEHQAIWMPHVSEIGWAVFGISVSLVTAFLLELPMLARRSFASLEEEGDELQSRAAVIALTIIFAGPAVTWLQSPYAWLALQLICKLPVDLHYARKDRNVHSLGDARPKTLAERLRAMRERNAARERSARGDG
jgi:hypothetical protein